MAIEPMEIVPLGRGVDLLIPRKPEKEEVEKAFTGFVESLQAEYPNTNFYPYPELLLLVSERAGEVGREYFFPPENLDSPNWHSREVSASFGLEDGVWQPLIVARAADGRNEFAITFNYFWRKYGGVFGDDSIELRDFNREYMGDVEVAQNVLDIEYSRNGNLMMFSFSPKFVLGDPEGFSLTMYPDGRWKRKPGAEVQVEAEGGFPLDIFLERGILEVKRGENRYKATHNPQKGTILLERERNGELSDRFEVPLRVSRRAILRKLFPRSYFSDPSCADPKKDITWRAATCETLGVKWDKMMPEVIGDKR